MTAQNLDHRLGFFKNRRVLFGLEVCLLLLGVFLRLKAYLNNCSLWMDEAWLAVSITQRSFREIVSYFSIYQTALPPVGFSLVVKIWVILTGNSEMSLRFIPLVAGTFSLFLYSRLLVRWLTPTAVIFGCAFFALSPALIRYSAEFKQYSLDVFMTVLLLWSFEKVRALNYSKRSILCCGIFCALSLWASYPSVFVSASIFMILIINFVSRKQWSKLRVTLMGAALCFVSFFWHFKVLLRNVSKTPYLLYYWRNDFLSSHLFSWDTILWMKTKVVEFFLDPMYLSPPLLAVFLFVVGIMLLFRKDKICTILCIFPFLLCLLAAALRCYPFRGRLLLFLYPMTIVFVAEGITFFVQHKKRIWIGLAMICFLFLSQIDPLRNIISRDSCQTEVRQSMAYLKQNYQSGDFIVFNELANPEFWYYYDVLDLSEQIPLEDYKGAKGLRVGILSNDLRIKDGSEFGWVSFAFHEVGPFGGFRKSSNYKKAHIFYKDSQSKFVGISRAWVFLANIPQETENFVLGYFNRSAQQLDFHKAKGANVYLYEF